MRTYIVHLTNDTTIAIMADDVWERDEGLHFVVNMHRERDWGTTVAWFPYYKVSFIRPL